MAGLNFLEKEKWTEKTSYYHGKFIGIMAASAQVFIAYSTFLLMSSILIGLVSLRK
jgi:hypothetical protein